jgi:hypothetical protein
MNVGTSNGDGDALRAFPVDSPQTACPQESPRRLPRPPQILSTGMESSSPRRRDYVTVPSEIGSGGGGPCSSNPGWCSVPTRMLSSTHRTVSPMLPV